MPGPSQIKSQVLVDQSYWDESYSTITPTMVPDDDQLRIWLERNVSGGTYKSCIEIGCYPARYLSVLGKLGYTLNGVDLTPRVVELKAQLSDYYTTGEFIHADFLEHQFHTDYDLVCSFGFIEHFTNWQFVLIKHAQLVKPGGLLVIETPNFGGWFQRMTHAWFDKENFGRHNIACMNPYLWKEVLEPLGFEVHICEYFGKYEFWSDTRKLSFLQRVGLRILNRFIPLLKKIKPGSRAFSPYCGLLAIRKHG